MLYHIKPEWREREGYLSQGEQGVIMGGHIEKIFEQEQAIKAQMNAGKRVSKISRRSSVLSKWTYGRFMPTGTGNSGLSPATS